MYQSEGDTMSKFPYAYCPSLQQDLEPEDLLEMSLLHEDLPYLQCPDEHCRKIHPDTEITPVCCNPRKPCEGMRPHFRTHTGDKHSDGCHYEILKQHTDYILSNKKEFRKLPSATNILRTLKGIQDTSLLPDEYIHEFRPTSEMNAIKSKAQEYIQAGHTRDSAYRMARCSVPHTTSRLSLIIDMADALEETYEREKVPLVLPGRKNATYETAFLSVYSLQHDYGTPYILCGDARVRATPDGFLLTYKYPLRNYHPDFPDIRALTPLKRQGMRPLLIRELEHYAESQQICYVYSFSTHRLNESTCPDPALNCCAVIEPITSGSIVIRDRCLKRSKKSSS